jgi:KaiC/GvpD/RAD55 family RecA-like ATPase
MTVSDGVRNEDFARVINEIKASDLSEVEKVAQAFDWVTGRYVENGRYAVELARAMKDQESLVKEQIKLSLMLHTRGIFQTCFKHVTGREAWDE